MRFRTLLPLLVIVACAVPASAQQLSLTIRDGLVNLDASGATVRQILDAWSRVGGTRIVNGERVAGGPVTMKLVDMPEKQALEIILRSVAGYMAAPRAANAAPGASTFDRIMVLPTSTSAPATSTAKAAPPAPQNPFFRGRGNLPEEADDIPAQDADAGQPPVFSFPNQNGEPPVELPNPFAQGGFNGAQQPATPFGTPMQPAPFGQPQGAPTPFGQPQAAPTPFGQPQAAPTPFGQPQTTPTPFGQPQNTPFGQVQPGAFGQVQQPANQNPFGQVQPTVPVGQGQAPVVNPFAAAAAQAQQQQLQQQQTAPAPGTFTIIGSPTPGVVTPPGQRPPGQQ